MRFLSNFDAATLRRQHPNWNLQPLAGWVDDGDCSISPLRSAQDLNSGATERMEGVKDLDVRALRTQGIVGGGVTIRMFIASSRPGACRRITNAGFTRGIPSFFR
jgi:hypothetical protein